MTAPVQEVSLSEERAQPLQRRTCVSGPAAWPVVLHPHDAAGHDQREKAGDKHDAE